MMEEKNAHILLYRTDCVLSFYPLCDGQVRLTRFLFLLKEKLYKDKRFQPETGYGLREHLLQNPDTVMSLIRGSGQFGPQRDEYIQTHIRKNSFTHTVKYTCFFPIVPVLIEPPKS